jgi:hypothetical protein
MLARAATLAEWTANQTTVLGQGEFGYVIGTSQLKVGDGVTPWASLPYISSGTVDPSGITLDDIADGSSTTRILAAIAAVLNSGHLNSLVDDATTLNAGKVLLASNSENASGKAVQANDARLSNNRNPTAHAATHEAGGSDPITLSFSLDDISEGVTSKKIDAAKADTINSGDVSSLVPDASTSVKGKVQLAASGSSDAGKAVQGNDTRLSNARTPLTHAATHKTGGSDALTAADVGAATSSDITTAVNNHAAVTTSIHGIADTSVLASKPKTGAGSGHIEPLSGAANSTVTLPGTSADSYFYFILQMKTDGTLYAAEPMLCSVAAGATVLGTGRSGYKYIGFCYKN